MKVVQETYWSLQTADDMEGRSYSEKYRTTSKAVADLWEDQSSWNNAREYYVSAIYIDSMADIKDAEVATKKAKALAKLSKEDRVLLGLE